MADNIFDQIHAEEQKGNVFDEIHAESKPQSAPEPPQSWKDQLGDAASHWWNMLKSGLDPHNGVMGMMKALDNTGEELKSAKESFQNGDADMTLAHIVRSVPVLGPLAHSLRNQLSNGQYGAAAGDLAGVLTVPKVMETIPEIPGTVAEAAGKVAEIPGKVADLAEANPNATLAAKGAAKIAGGVATTGAGHFVGPIAEAAGLPVSYGLIKSGAKDVAASLKNILANRKAANEFTPTEAPPEQIIPESIPGEAPAPVAPAPITSPPVAESPVVTPTPPAEPPVVTSAPPEQPIAPPVEAPPAESPAPPAPPAQPPAVYGIRQAAQALGDRMANPPEVPIPKSMLDNETTGVQIPQMVSNRSGVASRIADYLHENGITLKDIEAAKEDPTAHNLFWNNVGRIPGISKQAHYVPSAETIDATLDTLKGLEKAKKTAPTETAPATGPLANNPKALEIAKQMASAMGEEEPKPLQSVPKIPQATDLTPDERTVEQSFATKIAADPQAAMKEYRGKFTRPNGTLEINTDNARELAPEYSASNEGRTAYAKAVHEPSSWLAKKLYEDEVAKPAPKGTENEVMFTAGGTGSGKTTVINKLPSADKPPQIIYDTNSNNVESAQSKIDLALKNGKNVKIVYVHRLPEDAFEGMIDRAMNKGRPVPIDAHVETHVGAPNAIPKLAEIYKDNPKVDIQVIDNTRGPGRAKVGTIDMLKGLKYTGLKERLLNALERRKQEGTITPKIYAAIKGGEEDGAASGEKSERGEHEGTVQKSTGAGAQ